MSRAEFECFCGHNFQSWAERTPNFTVECRSCGRQLRPRYFLDAAPHDEDRYSENDHYSDTDDAPNFAPETARAEFECFCGHNFEGWAERTPTFTIECRSCGRLLRPRRFLDGVNNDEDRYSAEDHYSDTDAANYGDADAAHCAPGTERAEFDCFCGHTFEGWAERTPTFTLECRSCGRLLRPKRFIDVGASHDGDHCSATEHSYSDSDAADYDVHNDAGHYGADTSRAEFECFCGHNFEGWAERTPNFTLECRACGRLLRPRRFVDQADSEENKYAGDGDVDLPRYGVAWFNCFCGHGFTSYAERAPDFHCRCHQCGRGVSPAKFLPPGERGPKCTTDSTHSCCRCEGHGGRFACPVLQNA